MDGAGSFFGRRSQARGKGKSLGSFQQQQVPPAVSPLLVSLVDLYTGTTKTLKITHKRFSSSSYVDTQNVLMIDIRPGWKAGTKICFSSEGDEVMPGQCQDMEFILEEKPHNLFDSVNAMLDRNEEVTKPGHQERIKGWGMPFQKDPRHFGDLVIKFEVEFLESIPPGSKEDSKRIE